MNTLMKLLSDKNFSVTYSGPKFVWANKSKEVYVKCDKTVKGYYLEIVDFAGNNLMRKQTFELGKLKQVIEVVSKIS